MKRRFEITATVLLLASLVFIAGNALALTSATGPEAAVISEHDWTSLPAATAEARPSPAAEPKPVAEETKPVDKPPLYDVPMSDELQGYLYEACEETGVPFELALALIGNESGYRPEVISKTNDYGLMQINTCNHEWLEEELGVEDFLDPEDNITAGLYILSGYFEKYEDPNMVLMAYNMGEYGAQQQWEKGVYQTEYSRRVIARIDELERKEFPDE